jgi:hypothetical protein
MSAHKVRGLEQVQPTGCRVGEKASTQGVDMNATELPFLEQAPLEQAPPRSQPIEIIAPDRYCTAALLEHAAPLFPAEVVYDIEDIDGVDPVDRSAWIVRLEPPVERDWALELLSLVERWLESCRLPCAKVLYGGRSYLIRASTDGAWFQAAAESSHRLTVQG